ncbi:MAG: hypothetical protein GX275_05975 [Clostridiales bacterium]|nr:hypothetical protein [Clostridiales bacterium]
MAKSKWNEIKEKLKDVEKWAIMGLSDTQIAFNLGISKDTFYRYKKEHSDFSDTLKRGKNQADFKVENALYKKATGYTVKKVGVIKCKDIYYDDEGRKCQKEHADVVEYEEEMPADVQAIKFWLINRKSGKWKDNPIKADIDKQVLELRKKQVEQGEW